VLITISLLGALAGLVVGAVARPTVSSARSAVQRENLHQLESALEVFHAQHGRYPASLQGLLASPDRPPQSGGDKDLALLPEVPANPLGTWGYDGKGRVWAVDDRMARSDSGAKAASPTRAVPYHAAAVITLALALLASSSAGLTAGLLSSGWRTSWGACLQALAFRGGAWDHLIRSAWLGLAKDLIHSEGDLRSLVAYSSRIPLATGHALDHLTARLRDRMQRQAAAREIPIRGSQWRPALINFESIAPQAPAQGGPAGGRPGPLGRMFAPGLPLAIGGGALAILASRVAAVPLYGSAPTVLLLAASLLLALRVILNIRPAERRASA
jgi:type II secretory pathway pseudopilin PulG